MHSGAGDVAPGENFGASDDDDERGGKRGKGGEHDSTKSTGGEGEGYMSLQYSLGV